MKTPQKSLEKRPFPWKSGDSGRISREKKKCFQILTSANNSQHFMALSMSLVRFLLKANKQKNEKNDYRHQAKQYFGNDLKFYVKYEGKNYLSKTMLQWRSKAFTRPNNFLLLRQLIRTCVLFFTDCVKTDNGPVLNSSSSWRANSSGVSSDFGLFKALNKWKHSTKNEVRFLITTTLDIIFYLFTIKVDLFRYLHVKRFVLFFGAICVKKFFILKKTFCILFSINLAETMCIASYCQIYFILPMESQAHQRQERQLVLNEETKANVNEILFVMLVGIRKSLTIANWF